MKRLFFGICFLLPGFLLMNSCLKDNFDLDRLSTEVELEPELVAPLIYGSMSMLDITALFDSVSYIDEDPEGLIILVYGDTLVSVAADTMELPDLETTEFYLEADVDVPVWIPVDTLDLARRTRSIDFVLEGENDRLDEVFIKGGVLRMDVESTIKHTGNLMVSSQQILDKKGDPISMPVFIDDPSGNFDQTFTIPSDSFMLKPMVRNDSNLIFFDFDLALINSGQPISPGEHLIVQAGLTAADFYHVFGFIDTRALIEESGSLDITIWEDNPELSAISFAEPGIEITSVSSFGIPMVIAFDSVIATNANGDQLTLTIDDGNELEFNAPGMDQLGESVTTHNLINNLNSNIRDFIDIGPSSIIYSVLGRTSTTNDDTTHFILDESELDLVVEVLLPLDFKSTGFALTDTMDFEMGDAVDTSLVRNAEISLTTLNQLPLELEVQVLLLDEFYTVLDSIFDDERPLLGASLVDAEGKLVDAVEEINTVEFPIEKLGKLEQVHFMQVRAKLTTSDEGVPYVKIYSDYTLDFKISVLANLRINSEEL
jgi:hypothetical protein